MRIVSGQMGQTETMGNPLLVTFHAQQRHNSVCVVGHPPVMSAVTTVFVLKMASCGENHVQIRAGSLKRASSSV